MGMNCPKCDAEITNINHYADRRIEPVPWYKFQTPAKVHCPNCGVQLQQHTLAASMIIAAMVLTIGVLNSLYPDSTAIKVLFVFAILAVGVALPRDLKNRVRLTVDEP